MPQIVKRSNLSTRGLLRCFIDTMEPDRNWRELMTEYLDRLSQFDDPLIDHLTARELEVLSLITEGLSNPAIAEKLIISVGTVKAHTANIYRKLGVKNRVQAFSQAQELQLLSR